MAPGAKSPPPSLVPEPWTVAPDGVVLTVRVTPKGGRDAIDGIAALADGTAVLKVRVRAAAAEGEANAALLRLVAAALGVPARAVSLEAGGRGRVAAAGGGGMGRLGRAAGADLRARGRLPAGSVARHQFRDAWCLPFSPWGKVLPRGPGGATPESSCSPLTPPSPTGRGSEILCLPDTRKSGFHSPAKCS